MATLLTSLPAEVLTLIVKELGREHYDLVTPLARTFNKAIYVARSSHLKLRRRLMAKQRAICDAFGKASPGFYQWDEDLNLPRNNDTLSWLDDMIRDMDGYVEDPLPVSTDFEKKDLLQYLEQCTPQTRAILEPLILQTEAVGCELPRAFVKLCARYHLYGFLFLQEGTKTPSTILHKVHHRKGTTGYLIQFLEQDCGSGSFYLYLDPGPAKGNGVVATEDHICALPHNPEDDPGSPFEGTYDEKDLPFDPQSGVCETFDIQDSNEKTYKACHYLPDPDLELEATDFETWFAGQLFYWAAEHLSRKEWKRIFPAKTLRRAKFHEFLDANPEFRGMRHWPR